MSRSERRSPFGPRASARGDGAVPTPTISPEGTTGEVSMSTGQIAASRTEELLALTERYAAHNYHPLPVVIAQAEGAWVTDVEGKRYLDMLSAYSALNFGHRHPRLVEAAKRQLDRVTLTSRAFHNDLFGPFC